MANTRKIEKAAVLAVEEYIDECPKLVPYIGSNDKTPLWDGDIIVYSDDNHNISNLISRIPVIVKGILDTSPNTYYIDRKIIEAYNNIGGGIFFLVQVKENAAEILYSFLSVYEIDILSRQSSGSIKIELKKVPANPLDFEKEVLKFAVDRNKYKRNELWYESQYVSSLKTECENLSAYINDVETDREVLESILNRIKRFDRGDSSEFIKDISKIIEIVQVNKIDNPILLMNLMMNFASLLQEQNEFNKAVQYFKEAQKYALELADQNYYNKGELYESTEKLVDLYNEANEQDGLVETLSETISKYKEFCKTDPISYIEPLARTYKELAEYYYKKDKYRKAEKYYNDAFNLYLLLTQSNEEKYIKTVLDVLIKLCRIHKRFREYQEAKKDNTEAMEIFQDYNTSNFDSIDKAMVLAESANLNKELNNLKKAEKEYNQSLEDINLLNKKTNEYNFEKANVLASYADLYSKKWNALEAEKKFTDSIALYNQVGDSTTDIKANKARAIFMYGNFYASSNPKEAENKYIEALSIQEEFKSKDKYVPDYIDTLFALVRLNPGTNDSSDRFLEALELLYELVKKDPEENAAFLIIFLRTSTELYKEIRISNRENKHFEEIKEKYESCLNICREREKNNQEEYEEYVVDVLSCLARFYLTSEKYEDAENRYKELLDKCRKIAEHRTDYNINVALSLIDLGKFYQIYPNHNPDAETYFVEALEILQKLEIIGLDKYEVEIAETYNNLGNLYRFLGRKSEAEAQFGEALKRYQSLSSNNSKEYNEKVAQTAENIAYLLIDDENREDEATKAINDAITYYDYLANSESRLSIKYEEKIKQLKNTLNGLSDRQKISSSLKIKRAAVRAVVEYLDKCPKLEPYIDSIDKTLLWDGDVTVYKNKSHSNVNFFARIPLQVKGSMEANGNTFSIEREYIEAYKFEGGTAFFMVQEYEDSNKLFYALLSTKEIDTLLREYSKGNVKIPLQEVPSDPLVFEKELYEFAAKRNAKKNENATPKEIKELVDGFEEIREHLDKIGNKEARIELEGLLNFIKNLKRDDIIGWRDKFYYHSRKALDLAVNNIKEYDFAELQFKLGNYLQGQKQFHLAEDYYLKVLKEYRKRATDRPYPWIKSDVAKTLNYLAVLHYYLTRFDEAEKELKEALEICRQLAETNRDAYISEVAMTLYNLAALHVDLSRYDEAEKESKEALEIRRELAETNRDAYISDVADTLNNLAVLHQHLNCYHIADMEYKEALKIRRELAETNRDAYISDVAMTLNNMAHMHYTLTRYEEAEKEYKEALVIRCELAKTNRDAFIGDVADTLDNLAALHDYLTRYDEAEKEYKEALEIRRELAKTNRDAYIRYIATTLNNLAMLHQDLNRYDEAEKEYNEALEIRRELAKTNRDAYIGDLAMTLNNQAILHHDLNRYDEAEQELQEALKIRRELAETNRDAYIADVAMTLYNIALLQEETDRKAEAKKTAEEALGIFKELAKAYPQIWKRYVERCKQLLLYVLDRIS